MKLKFEILRNYSTSNVYVCTCVLLQKISYK